MDRDLTHKPLYITSIALACVAFLTACVFNAFAATGSTGIFHHKTGDVSNYFYTDITPAAWTFSIWGVIYVWQALWLIYSVSTICRKTAYGYIYINPNPQPPVFYVIYVFNMAANVCWLVLWDRHKPGYALIPMITILLSLCLMLFISYRRCYFVSAIFIREGKLIDFWLLRAFTQNGLALYAAWVTIATLLNLDVVLIYIANVSMSNGGTICLSVLFLTIITWFFLDILVFDRYARYTLTPYFVFIFSLTGLVIKLWNLNINEDTSAVTSRSSNTVLAEFMLVVSCILAVLKIILMFYRALKQPLFSNNQSSLFSPQVTYGTMSGDHTKASAPIYDSS